jgi:hypothetical protein
MEATFKRNPTRLSKSATGLLIKLYNNVKQFRLKKHHANPVAQTTVARPVIARTGPSPVRAKTQRPATTSSTRAAGFEGMQKRQEEAKRRWEEKKLRLLMEQTRGAGGFMLPSDSKTSILGDLTPAQTPGNAEPEPSTNLPSTPSLVPENTESNLLSNRPKSLMASRKKNM